MPTPDGHGGDAPVAVLGIDAAWTPKNPSGIALWIRNGGRWSCAQVAGSFSEFLGLGDAGDHGSHEIDVPVLLTACRNLIGDVPIGAVAVDMPLARAPITGRRVSDDAVSKAFGGRGCGVHSPTHDRPGDVGRRLQAGFEAAGFRLACQIWDPVPALIEVYPHVYILALTGQGYRVPYKAAKTNRYWPGLPLAERRERLLGEWQGILKALSKAADISEFRLPDGVVDLPLSRLKAIEDQMDALVCAWTAVEFMEGRAVPLGDSESAIWVPVDLVG
jgi:predicted RNase H-like nuclease